LGRRGPIIGDNPATQQSTGQYGKAVSNPYVDPYTPNELSQDPGTRIARRLDLSTAAAVELQQLMLEDLDVELGGIRWWHESMSKARSILIGDYMVAVTDGIPANVLEAALHVRELGLAEERLAERFRVHARAGGPPGTIPTPESPADELPLILIPMHIAGAFRAMATALDCLAAVVVSVVGLRFALIRASWGPVMKDLQRLADSSETEPAGMSRQGEFARQFLRVLDESGPSGWLQWTLDLRNMVVHRARILTAHHVRVRGSGSGLQFPRDVAIGLIETPLALPARPDLSEVDAIRLLGDLSQLLMTEPGAVTTRSALKSTQHLVDGTCLLLATLWKERRADPKLIEQPATIQWPVLTEKSTASFAGYDPRSLPFDPGLFWANQVTKLRFASAFLDDERIALWPGLIRDAQNEDKR
jgi:hypothetical protein